MREKFIILSNAVFLALLGTKIDLYSRLIITLFRKRRLLFLCARLDRRLMNMRKDFIMLQKRHLSFICLDI